MKLATIGTSAITQLFIEAAKESERYELWAVYSRNIERAESFRDKYGAKYSCDSLEAIGDSQAQIVYIASPNSLHFQQARFFLERGKHVICEKPIVTREGQLPALIKLAKEQNVFLLEAFRHIHTPGFKIIKEQLKEISPVRSVIINMNQYSSRYDRFLEGEIANVFNPDFDGGAKLDLGVYNISLAAALFGRPEQAFYKRVNLQNGICGAGAYLLEYRDFICCLMFSKISEDITESQIIGEKGGISFNAPTSLSNISFCERGGQKRVLYSGGAENPLIYEANVFADIIESRDMARYNELTQISKITSELVTKN